MKDILDFIEKWDFFSAFKKLDKLAIDIPEYQQLKKAFNHGKYAADFPNKLKNFVLNLNEIPSVPLAQDNQPLVISTTPPSPVITQKKILFLSANPKDTALLNLNKEYNAIQDELRGLENKFDLEIALDINIDNFSRLLNQYKPQVLHFSGHGDEDGLFFYGDAGYSEEIATTALGKMLRHYPFIELLFLNACYSENQLADLAQHIPNVIGAKGQLPDEKANLFAVRFYRHLFAGCSYLDAFFRATDEIALYGMDAQFVLYKDNKIVS